MSKPKPSRKRTINAAARKLGTMMVDVLRAQHAVQRATMFFSPKHASPEAKRNVAIVVRRHQVLKSKYQKQFDQLQKLIIS